jgi:hypothetical protein
LHPDAHLLISMDGRSVAGDPDQSTQLRNLSSRPQRGPYDAIGWTAFSLDASEQSVMSHPWQTRSRSLRPTLRRLMLCVPFLVLAHLALTGCSGDSPREVVTRHSVSDASGDVVVGGLGKDPEAVSAAPRNAITDILHVTIDHGVEAVTFEVVFKDLRPRQYLDLTAYVRTDSTGSRLPAQATALAYRGESSVDLYVADGSRCATAAVALDFDINTLIMTVPRSCLDKPRWVEAEVIAATMRYEAAPDDPSADAVWEDHACRTGRTRTAGAEASPRLYHP